MHTLAFERGPSMEDQLPQIPGGPWGSLGAFGMAILAAVLWFKRLFRKDSLESVEAGTSKDIISMLNAQLKIANDRADRERGRADKERERADTSEKALFLANQKIEDLSRQVRNLTALVESLKKQVDGLSGGRS